MKAMILAGGRGSRLSEETHSKPKPLVEAGGKPLIWHIMQNYARFGVNEFIVLAGYKGDLIRKYFSDYWLHQTDITFDLSSPNMEVHHNRGLPWKVTVLETGVETMTAGRMLRARHLVDEPFFLTYGDGIADVDINQLLETFQTSGHLATLTAVQPPARFGALSFEGKAVTSFQEKPTGDGAWINGGFFVFSPEVFRFISGDSDILESDVLPRLAEQRELSAYFHDGFWQPVDTVRDLYRLEQKVESRTLPWML
jgi:glucose-1-phosphate cytidylyltransferase